MRCLYEGEGEGGIESEFILYSESITSSHHFSTSLPPFLTQTEININKAILKKGKKGTRDETGDKFHESIPSTFPR